MPITIPNLLTYARIIAIPLVVGSFYWDAAWSPWVAVALYVAAAITDYFDGYLARKLNQVSAVGRFLDPIADKLLVAAVLVMLLAMDRISTLGAIPTIVILCREILVSGLREFLAEIQVSMPVTRLAKWKTAAQLVALPVLLVGHVSIAGVSLMQVGEVLLWLAALMTVITGWVYLRLGMAHMIAQDREAGR